MGLVKKIDEEIALTLKKVVPTKESLISILIHGIFKNSHEAFNSNSDPQQSITVNDFERIIQFYLYKGYVFLSQEDLAKGLTKKNNYCFLTFDDGYFNNINALKILEKYNVPATFYCSTAHILEQKSYWWDVYYRGRKKAGTSIVRIREEKKKIKKMKIEDIEVQLVREFGKDAFKPVDDTDRPMNEKELKDFANHPLVSIGNHTHNHIIIPRYSPKEIEAEIFKNQEILLDITGVSPKTIAYPNGDLNDDLIPLIRNIGLKMGLTTIKGKNELPIKSGSDVGYLLKRYTPWHNNLKRQLELTETDFHVKNMIKQ